MTGEKEPKPRRYLFWVDRRAWKIASEVSMNSAIAYLVMASGASTKGRTAWSAQSVSQRAGLPWKMAKEAIAPLIERGLVDKLQGGRKPVYMIRPAHEVPGCAGFPQAELSPFESNLLTSMREHDQEPVRLPEGSHKHKLAVWLVKKGYAQAETGGAFRALPDARTPQRVFLPNEIVEGADGETAPIVLLRESQNLPALRLLVRIYDQQNLPDFGGVDRHSIHQNFERKKLGEWGSYVIWGFARKNLAAIGSPDALASTFMTDKEEVVEFDGKKVRQDTGWPVFWHAAHLLADLGLTRYVPHVVNTDRPGGTIVHPCDAGSGSPAERALARAAYRAAQRTLKAGVLERATNQRLILVPVLRHIEEVAMVGVLRPKYLANTDLTKAWMAKSGQWEAHAKALDLLAASSEDSISRRDQG